MDLAGRVGLVTGGGTGIGRSTVLGLVRAGAAGVAINFRRSRAEAESVAEEVRQLGAEPICIQADVSQEADVQAMLQTIKSRFGRLDLLVNNAGVTHWVAMTDLDGLTDEVWRDILDVNLVGAFRCIRAAVPLLKETRGAVVNVTSISAFIASPTSSSLAYGAAKAGLVYMTKGLALALAPEVRVNAVAPSFTDTRWMSEHYGDEYQQRLVRVAESFPMGRVAGPADIAAAIVSLATGSDFVTGQTLVVDGGLTLS
jgi:NAD(P)-dependent dehydrogenase (short-subunit alcohol dehydrogenase family)